MFRLQGIVESLECRIRDSVQENPTETVVLKGLNNYERLIGHACASYHNLHSKSEFMTIF